MNAYNIPESAIDGFQHVNAVALIGGLLAKGETRYAHEEGDGGWRICPNLLICERFGWLEPAERPGAWTVTDKAQEDFKNVHVGWITF